MNVMQHHLHAASSNFKTKSSSSVLQKFCAICLKGHQKVNQTKTKTTKSFNRRNRKKYREVYTTTAGLGDS